MQVTGHNQNDMQGKYFTFIRQTSANTSFEKHGDWVQKRLTEQPNV